MTTCITECVSIVFDISKELLSYYYTKSKNSLYSWYMSLPSVDWNRLINGIDEHNKRTNDYNRSTNINNDKRTQQDRFNRESWNSHRNYMNDIRRGYY